MEYAQNVNIFLITCENWIGLNCTKKMFIYKPQRNEKAAESIWKLELLAVLF